MATCPAAQKGVKTSAHPHISWKGVCMHGHVKVIQHFRSDRSPFWLCMQTFGPGMAKTKDLAANLAFQCAVSANCPSRVHHTLALTMEPFQMISDLGELNGMVREGSP